VKNTKFFALIVSLFAFVLLVPFSVKAVSMSTSPANMIMENLLPGSSYEYPITFQLQDLTSDAKVTISTELTGFDNWITFLPSKEFIYKSDLEKQIITVKVDVPTDAIVQNYKGYIRINVVDPTNQAMTSIVSGSRIDVSLDLTTKVIEKLDIVAASIDSFKADSPLSLMINLHNVGNGNLTITKATINVIGTDNSEVATLNSDTNITIPAFSFKESTLEFTNKLEAGSYKANIVLFKGSEIIASQTIPFSVDKSSAIVSTTPVLDSNLSLVIIVLIVIAFLILAYIVFIGIRNNSKKNTVTMVLLSALVLPMIAYLGYQYQQYSLTKSMLDNNQKVEKAILGVSIDVAEPTTAVEEPSFKTITDKGEYIVFEKADYNSKQIALVKAGDNFNAVEDGDWYKITLENNTVGYLPKTSIKSVN